MTSLDALAEQAGSGEAISEADARVLLDTPDLIAVGVIADEVRRRIHGARTTFVRVFEVHVDAPPAALPPRVTAGELRVVGVPASLEHAMAAVRGAALLAGGVPVTGFSLADIQTMAGSGSMRMVCEQLRGAGLDAIAELPIDRVADAELALREVRQAGLHVLRLTVEAATADRGIALAVRAHGLQAAVGGLCAFAPLPRTLDPALPSTGYDDVKQVAVARLIAVNIASIQVDWVLYGPKLAQVALTMGADDIDRVAAADPGLLGTRRSPIEEIRGNIRAAGLEAVERNGRFEPVTR